MQGCQKYYLDGGVPDFLRGCLFFLEKIEWGCQISWGAKYRVTPGRGSKQQLATSSLLEQVSVLDLVLICHLSVKSRRFAIIWSGVTRTGMLGSTL